jgi:adenylate cyclase
MRDIYQEGIRLYRKQQWEQARVKFEESEQLEEVFPKRPTTPSQVYIQRCDHFGANPPGGDCDGRWPLSSK